MNTFDEYKIAPEPTKQKKAYAWSTAVGLQAVDGLQTSEYLHFIAKKNIDGEISLSEAQNLLDSYYENSSEKLEERAEEADKVSSRIAELLLDDAFSLSVAQYIAIHKYLFSNIYKHSGKIRTYNITKPEWVLGGNTVTYGNALNIKEMLEYDISREKEFEFNDMNIEDIISHISRFVSNLWQIHAFGEGNTRTTAVFLIKYLRTLGFDVDNDLFENNAKYFRNALVRANYNDLKNGIRETTEFLDLFLRNLLLKETNPLHSRDLYIGNNITNVFSQKTLSNIEKLKEAFGDDIFNRSDVMSTLKITESPASTLIKKMLDSNIIEPVKGHGKGKYRIK